MIGGIIFLIVLLILSAFFSGIEIALVSVSRIKVRTFLALRKKGATTLSKLKSNPKRMIITVLIGNNIVNILASAYTAVLLEKAFGQAGIAYATGLMTLLILTFGEILPKTYFAKNADRLSLKFAKIIYIMELALLPFVVVFEYLSKLVAPGNEGGVTEGEIKAAIEMGAEGSILHEKQKEFMKSVFEFDDIPVKDIMTPRVDMFALEENSKIKDIIKKVKFAGYSRIPIYKESLDKITGYFHIRDMLNIKGTIELKKISSNITYVSSEKIIQELFADMQRNANHIAIVVDEFGGTAGVVTMEDILEELVGEIQDEHDDDEIYIKKLNKNTFVVDGDVEIDEINSEIGLNLKSEGSYNTISGYIQYMMKDIPSKGETFQNKKATFEILKNSSKKIDIIKIVKKDSKKK